MSGGKQMNSLQVMNSTQEMQTARLGYEVFDRFVAYLDAKPKTIATYTAALKQFFCYMAERDIQAPQFEDVKAYRDYLLATCKPTTVQAYIFAVRKFFQFTADQGLYPNVAGRLKGCKLDKSPKKDHLTQQQVKAVMCEIDQTAEQGKRNFAMICLTRFQYNEYHEWCLEGYPTAAIDGLDARTF